MLEDQMTLVLGNKMEKEIFNMDHKGRNYQSYYNENLKEKENFVAEEVEEVEEIEEVEEVKEEVEEVKEEVEEKKDIINSLKGRVIGNANLNVREKASSDSKIVAQLNLGQSIFVNDISNPEWYKLQDIEGYVMKKFIDLI